MTFLITYDLRDRTADHYAALDAFLTQQGAARIALSVWVVDLQTTPIALRDALRASGHFNDHRDTIIVAELVPGGMAAWNSLDDAAIRRLGLAR